MELGVLFTGGKDSTYSLYLASKENTVRCLINITSSNPDSYMFHTVASSLVELQSEALGLPLIRASTEAIKEKELDDLESAIKSAKDEYGIGGIVTGAIESRYQSDRVSAIAGRLGLKVINPLWHTDVRQYMHKLIDDGFKVVIVSVSADGLTEDMLGKEIDSEVLGKLEKLSEEYHFHLAFEGGEAETAVLDAPIFKRGIVLDSYSIKSEGTKSFLVIDRAHLVNK
ncbi:MAG: diphthine--ammonia ligase [Candidatus Acidifodinimicrobium sp.]